MCGIAGVINPEAVNLEAMKFALKHRGPDAQSIYIDANVALIHARLSIQDVAHGLQPFHYEGYSIVFNGEIYNHLDLRSRLSEFTFKTHSDTETLLYLYIKFGSKMYELIDGMFAFCIYDKAKDCLVLGRDRAGKKPLYYMIDEGKFLFASELNTLKAVRQLAISEDAIAAYLRMGYVWGSHTVYQGVSKLAAGSHIEVNVTSLAMHITPYFDIGKYYAQQKIKLDFEQTTDLLEEKLLKSVVSRMSSSDVEVGAFLSGGIDSGLIVAMAAKSNPKLKTFTVRFDGSYDESPLARKVAEKYHTEHFELEVQTNLKQDIGTILLGYGEPFMDSSAIPTYYVSKAAREHVKVVLNGDGADELFGGYRRYVMASHPLFKKLKWLVWSLKFLPKPHKKQSMYNYLYRALSAANKNDLDYYVSVTSDIYEEVYSFGENRILAELAIYIAQINNTKNLSDLSKLMLLDFKILLFGDLLVKMDIASMANSLEARSPFLSKYLLEFAPTLPDSYKINKLTTKNILRHLAKRYLPDDLILQPKRGFEVPLKRWVEHDLKENIYDCLQVGCYSEKYLSRDFIQKLLASSDGISAEKRAKILWNLYCLEIWYKHEK